MDALHSRFLERIRPVVLAWARKRFGRDEDRVADSVALAWQWAKRLHERGKDPCTFRCKFAQYVVRAVRCGRRITRQNRAKDAMNPLAWQRGHFTVQSLPVIESFAEHDNPYAKALADHRNAPVAEHVAFKIDWTAFMADQNERLQKIAAMYAAGESNKAVAQALGVTDGRATHLRHQLRDDWRALQGE